MTPVRPSQGALPDIPSHSGDTQPRIGIAAGFEVRIQHQPIDIQAEIAPIMRNPNVGAVVNFVGVVRNSGDSDDVVALELEHYPGMTEHSLWGIVEEADARWKVIPSRSFTGSAASPSAMPSYAWLSPRRIALAPSERASS